MSSLIPWCNPLTNHIMKYIEDKEPPNDIIRFDSIYEIDDIKYKRYWELLDVRDYLQKQRHFEKVDKRKTSLTKMFKKRRRRENAKIEYLKIIELANLPHDLENLIFTYIY